MAHNSRPSLAPAAYTAAKVAARGAHASTTAHMLFEKSLIESQTEASLDGILVVSPEGEILMHNHRFVQLWGDACANVIASGSDQELLAAVSAALQDPDEFAGRVQYLYAHPHEESREAIHLKDGRVFDRYSAPVKGRSNEFYGRVWFFRDISEEAHARAQVEKLAAELSSHVTELKHTQDDLQHAVRARDEFLSIASHELKTPVTALHLQIQNILRATARTDRKPTEAWLLEKVTRSESQLLRLSRLIDNLLDVSRITGGRLEFELEEVDLGGLVRDTADRLRDEATRKGSSITIDAPAGVCGLWDRLRLEQVVTNLISNAVKYGGGKPIVLTVQAIAGGGATLAVRDHGIGISEQNQARIFERFERAVSERQYGGLGLGLWITRQIVEALGGAIRVESHSGAGSCFTVDLPAAAPELKARGADCQLDGLQPN